MADSTAAKPITLSLRADTSPLDKALECIKHMSLRELEREGLILRFATSSVATSDVIALRVYLEVSTDDGATWRGFPNDEAAQ